MYADLALENNARPEEMGGRVFDWDMVALDREAMRYSGIITAGMVSEGRRRKRVVKPVTLTVSLHNEFRQKINYFLDHKPKRPISRSQGYLLCHHISQS